MTKSTNQQLYNDEVASVATQAQTIIPQQAVPIAPRHEYTPDSVWVNIRYGLGMFAFIAIPPLLPGATVNSVIMGYMSVIFGIYFIIGIMTAVRIKYPTRNHTRGRQR